MLCWGPEEDWAGIWGGACLGMLQNIHLRGRYLLKFQLLREMAEAEWGLAFALKRDAFSLPQASVSDLSQGKKAVKPSSLSLTARQTRQGQVGAAGLAYISSSYISIKKKKKTNMKKSLSTGKTGPNVCFGKKAYEKGVVWAYLSLVLPLPSNLQHCHIYQPLSPLPFAPWLAAWLEAAGKWGETRRAISIAAWLLLLRAVLRILHMPLLTAGPLRTSPLMTVRLEARLADWERLSQDVPSHAYFYGCSRCLNKSHLK